MAQIIEVTSYREYLTTPEDFVIKVTNKNLHVIGKLADNIEHLTEDDRVEINSSYKGFNGPASLKFVEQSNRIVKGYTMVPSKESEVLELETPEDKEEFWENMENYEDLECHFSSDGSGIVDLTDTICDILNKECVKSVKSAKPKNEEELDHLQNEFIHKIKHAPFKNQFLQCFFSMMSDKDTDNEGENCKHIFTYGKYEGPGAERTRKCTSKRVLGKEYCYSCGITDEAESELNVLLNSVK